MLTVIVLLLFTGVIAFDFVPQIKQPDTRKRDIAAYVAFVVLSFAMLLLYSLYVTVPSPIKSVLEFIQSLFHLE